MLSPRPKFLIQLLLTLALVLNALWAPWAMAGLLGGHHASSHLSTLKQKSLVHAAASPCHAHPDVQRFVASPKHHDCCERLHCQCGCVLPPAMNAGCVELVLPPRHVLRVHALPRMLMQQAQTPPLRPPAA